MMGIITLSEIAESDRIKKEACNRIKEQVKDKLSAEELDKLEEIFFECSKDFLFKKRI